MTLSPEFIKVYGIVMFGLGYFFILFLYQLLNGISENKQNRKELAFLQEIDDNEKMVYLDLKYRLLAYKERR